MAKNATTGRGRVGQIKNRIQSFNSLTRQYVESNTQTGKFLNVKSDGRPFKSVRRHKPKAQAK